MEYYLEEFQLKFHFYNIIGVRKSHIIHKKLAHYLLHLHFLNKHHSKHLFLNQALNLIILKKLLQILFHDIKDIS